MQSLFVPAAAATHSPSGDQLGAVSGAQPAFAH